MERKRRAVGTLERLKWAARLAQEDSLTDQDACEWAEELRAWTGVRPTGEECERVRKRFNEILGGLADTGRAVLGHGTVEVWRDKNGAGIFTRPAVPAGEDLVVLAVARLGTLLAAEGHRVKRCLAPRGVGETSSERCERLFVGRPNQDYCGSLCGNRATTRANRLGGEIAKYRGHEIRVNPVRVGDQWVPAVEVESPEGISYIEPNPINPASHPFGVFPNRHRAVRRGIGMAKRLIDARLQV